MTVDGTNLASSSPQRARLCPPVSYLLKVWPILILQVSTIRLSCVVIAALFLCSATGARSQITENNRRLSMPNSRLHRPYQEPIFITGHLGLGGGLQYSPGQINYGASFIFRPGSSANFLDYLHKFNIAMVLQLDYQKLTAKTRMVSGDFILRRYLQDRGDEDIQILPFVSVGFGATDVSLTASEGGGNSRYWSGLLEVGQEWFFRPNMVFVARGQFRYFSYGEATVTTWSISGSVGFPVPW